MAKPKYHIAATIILFILLQLLKLLFGITPTWWSMVMGFTLLFTFGVLIDTDHIYGGLIWWSKRFIKREKVNLPKGWNNKFHTFKALAAVILISIVFDNYLPILAYGVHMFIDGANRANNGSWKGKKERYSYLPWYIHQYYPIRMQFYIYEEKE